MRCPVWKEGRRWPSIRLWKQAAQLLSCSTEKQKKAALEFMVTAYLYIQIPLAFISFVHLYLISISLINEKYQSCLQASTLLTECQGV